nr:MAG TPA: hypothetical protein [Caudoviricetes sp.]
MSSTNMPLGASLALAHQPIAFSFGFWFRNSQASSSVS